MFAAIFAEIFAAIFAINVRLFTITVVATSA
jgi:hypothetical protein